MTTEGLDKNIRLTVYKYIFACFNGSIGVYTLKVYLLICGHNGRVFGGQNMLKYICFTFAAV